MAQGHKRAFVTPPSQGDSSTNSSTLTAPELAEAGPKTALLRCHRRSRLGRNQPPNVSDLPPTRPTLGRVDIQVQLTDDDLAMAPDS